MPRRGPTTKPPARQSDAPEKARADGVERAATVAAALLGLAGYLYALGGIVIWLRLQTARIPPDGAIVAVDPRHLLAVGARVVAFELFLLLAVSAIVTALVALAVVRRGPITHPIYGKRFGAIEAAWSDKPTLGGFIGPEFALLLIALGMSVERPAPRHLLLIAGAVLATLAFLAMIFREPPRTDVKWRITFPPSWRRKLEKRGNKLELEALRFVAALLLPIAAGTAVFLLPILQGMILLAGTVLIYAGPLVRWPGTDDFGTFRRELLLSSGVWTSIAVVTAVALAWVATPPVSFSQADVSAAGAERAFASGAFLARTDAGVYLGICTPVPDDDGTSTDAHIQLVPAAQSASLTVGPGGYAFDPGGRPSIFMAARAMVSSGSAEEGDAPLHHSLLGEARDPCDPDR